MVDEPTIDPEHNDDPAVISSMDPQVNDPPANPPEDPPLAKDPPEPTEPALTGEEQRARESLSEDERRLLEDEDAHFHKGKYRVPIERIAKVTGKVKDQEREIDALKVALAAQKDLRSQPPEQSEPVSREQIAQLWESDPLEAQRVIAREEASKLEAAKYENQQRAELRHEYASLVAEGDRRAKEKHSQLNIEGPQYDPLFFDACTKRAVERGWLQPVPPDPQRGRETWTYQYRSPSAYEWAADEIAKEQRYSESADTGAAAEKIRKARAKKQSMASNGSNTQRRSGNGASRKLSKAEKRAAEIAGLTHETYLKYKLKTSPTEVTVDE